MRAAYRGRLWTVADGQFVDTVLLEPVDGPTTERALEVNLSDPDLILDPTDDEVADARPEGATR